MILTFKFGEMQTEFKVEKEHKIKEVLKILKEDVGLEIDLETCHYITSKRRNQKINSLYTFEEAKIFNGDTLVIGK